MEQFLQAMGAVFIAVILSLSLGKQGKEMAVLLAIFACARVMVVALTYLRPVMDFLERLESVGELSDEMVAILFKVTGIGILTEIAALVCTDSGSATLGKALQILGTAVILWLCIPVFTTMMDLVQEILGGI